MLTFLVACVAAASVMCVVFSVVMKSAPRPADLLEARLAQFTESGRMPTTLAEVELSLPFFERVIRPALDTFGRLLTRRTQGGSQAALQEKLNLAGRPWGLTASGFVALRLLSLVLFLAVGSALALLLALPMPNLLLGPVAGGVLGFLLPQIMLSRRVKRRKKEILLALPNALDLLTISVEAGLSFDASIPEVFLSLVAGGTLGRKSGEGFYDYTKR